VQFFIDGYSAIAEFANFAKNKTDKNFFIIIVFQNKYLDKAT